MLEFGKSIMGAVGGAGMGLGGAALTNKYNRAATQKQMMFQLAMSNTQMQRRVQDLKAAGLNPMLAYMSGGASSPQGGAIGAPNFGEAMVKGATSGSAQQLARQQTKADVSLKTKHGKQADAGVLAAEAGALQAYSQQSLNERQEAKLVAELPGHVRQITAGAANAEAAARIKAIELQMIKALLPQALKRQKMYETPFVGTGLTYAGELMPLITGGVGAGLGYLMGQRGASKNPSHRMRPDGTLQLTPKPRGGGGKQKNRRRP